PNIRIVKSIGSLQYTFRLNWKIKPFDNPRIRQAAMIALDQSDFLQAAIGDSRFYATCKALFTCNTPLASEAGMDGMLTGNSDKARPGWPCDTEMEKLRDDYARATTPQDRARLAEAAQVLNTKIVTQIPIGEFWNVTAVGKNVAFEASSMVTVYWGIDKR